MSTPAPYQQPNAPQAGHANNPLTDAVIRAAVDNAIHEARRQGTTPQAVIGSTPPVQQPGRPPMSSSAVDYAVRVLSTGVASVLVSGGASLVMVASGYANTTVIGLIAGAPIAIAVPIAALGSFARRAKEVVQAAPPEIHQYYSGTVHQDQRQTHVNTRTLGAIAVTRNELPPAR